MILTHDSPYVSHLFVHAFKAFRGFRFAASCAYSNMASLMQLYLKIFHSESNTPFQARKGRVVDLSYPLLKMETCPDFGKKGPDCIHICVKFSIPNVVLEYLGEKNYKTFPYGTSFSRIFDEMLIKVPTFHEVSPTLKNFSLPTCV